MKRLLKRTVSSAYSFLQQKGLFAPDREMGFRILLYHSIDEACDDDYLGIRVTPDNFVKQMEFLSRENYKVHSLKELITALKEKKELPRKTIAITFDDGYKDNLKNALPLLKSFRFSVTIFIKANYQFVQEGRSKYYWEKWAYLSKEDLKDLAGFDNIDIGSHSLSHRGLLNLSDKEIAKEALLSKEVLEEASGRPICLFSYPYGALNSKVKGIIRQAGYQAACCSFIGRNIYATDLFELRRTEINASDGISEFRKKLDGSYDWLLPFQKYFKI